MHLLTTNKPKRFITSIICLSSSRSIEYYISGLDLFPITMTSVGVINSYVLALLITNYNSFVAFLIISNIATPSTSVKPLISYTYIEADHDCIS